MTFGGGITSLSSDDTRPDHAASPTSAVHGAQGPVEKEWAALSEGINPGKWTHTMYRLHKYMSYTQAINYDM